MTPLDRLEELRRVLKPPLYVPKREKEPFRVYDILIWADIEYSMSGSTKWPTRRSGKVISAPSLTWARVERALRNGLVDDPEVHGRSLAWLLRECRGAPCRRLRPDLKPTWIMRWAVEHRDVEWEWPTASSGPIEWVPGESWRTVDNALRKGRRGMPGGSSLEQFLTAHRRKLNRMLREYRWLWSPEQVRRWERRKLKFLFRCGECRYVFEACDETGELDCSKCPDCPFGIVWNECGRPVDLSIEFAESGDACPDCDGDYPPGWPDFQRRAGSPGPKRR